MKWGKTFSCIIAFLMLDETVSDVLLSSLSLVGSNSLNHFLVRRSFGDTVLEEQYERFKKAMAENDNEAAEQIMKELG